MTDLNKEDCEFFLENIPGLMIIDNDGKLIYMNQQCADYIKRDRDMSIGKHINTVFPPSRMENLLKGNTRICTDFYFYEGRMSVSTQIQLRRKGKIVGVLEYDAVQDIESLEDILDKYSSALNEEKKYYREQYRNYTSTKYSIKNIIGSSRAMEDLRASIKMAAKTNSTVLITGETGTGKELVAHAIHNLSHRKFENFIKVNAANIPEHLAESEFFGYEEGAFTGAQKGGKKGKFELANKGTILIDEVNQLPLNLQPKLLRVLQEKEIDRLGGYRSIPVDVRVIATTNQDLKTLVNEKKFREDLYFRLNVFDIEVPPLREHLEDIPELINYRIKQLNLEMGKNVNRIDEPALRYLMNHSWPGNVRELCNTIEKAMIYADGDVLKLEHFRFDLQNDINLKEITMLDRPIDFVKREAERKLLLHVLSVCGNNKTEVAKYLKISRPLLYQKLKRLGIKYNNETV